MHTLTYVHTHTLPRLHMITHPSDKETLKESVRSANTYSGGLAVQRGRRGTFLCLHEDLWDLGQEHCRWVVPRNVQETGTTAKYRGKATALVASTLVLLEFHPREASRELISQKGRRGT